MDRQGMEEWVYQLMPVHTCMWMCARVHARANSLVGEFLSN